jgi:sensor c-di-GMP phosphodiesterase-like protein
VGPDIFVKIAEDHGFVGEITKFVIRTALAEFGETLRRRPGFRLSINVAAADLSDPGFLNMLGKSLDESKVKAESLAIEITESSTARHEVAIAAILKLSRAGLEVHIDDFGTGYSSLSYLNGLAIHAIKIDRSFTQAIGTEAVTVSILPQILAMAAALKLKVIVEGVETAQQAEYFTACSQPILAQGWFFGRPIPAVQFHEQLGKVERKAMCPAETVPV